MEIPLPPPSRLIIIVLNLFVCQQFGYSKMHIQVCYFNRVPIASARPSAKCVLIHDACQRYLKIFANL